MKIKNEVLKQSRILANMSVEHLSMSTGLSTDYITRLEAGNVENLDYIYGRYAKAFRLQENRLKRMVNNAQKYKWNLETICEEVKKMFNE